MESTPSGSRDAPERGAGSHGVQAVTTSNSDEQMKIEGGRED